MFRGHGIAPLSPEGVSRSHRGTSLQAFSIHRELIGNGGCAALRTEPRITMAEQGIYPSRPPFGYRNNVLEHTIELDPEKAPVAQ